MRRVAMYMTGKVYAEKAPGGVKRFRELYEGLMEKGYSVDLYSCDSTELQKKKDVTQFPLKISNSIKLNFLPKALIISLSNRNIIRIMKKQNYDKVIVFDVPTAIGLCLMGVKNIQLFIRQDLILYRQITINEKTSNTFLIWIYLNFLKICETICIIASEKIIVQCKYDYKSLIKRHKIISHIIKVKTRVQMNNVNPSWILKKSNLANKFGSWEKQTEKFSIVFIGDFNNNRKGQRIFVDAIKKMMDANYEIEAVLISSGRQLEGYKNECDKYSDIKFTGRLNNPIEILKKCDLMVVPSLADSFPNTIMEALHNNIPVIATKVGGIPEILDNEVALFEPNSDKLVKKISILMNERILDALKTQQYKRKIALQFDWIDQIIQLIM